VEPPVASSTKQFPMSEKSNRAGHDSLMHSRAFFLIPRCATAPWRTSSTDETRQNGVMQAISTTYFANHAASQRLPAKVPRKVMRMALPFPVRARYDSTPTRSSQRRAASRRGFQCGLMGKGGWERTSPASSVRGLSSTRTDSATGRWSDVGWMGSAVYVCASTLEDECDGR